MLKFKGPPNGRFIKRNTVVSIDAIFSGDVYIKYDFFNQADYFQAEGDDLYIFNIGLKTWELFSVSKQDALQNSPVMATFFDLKFWYTCYDILSGYESYNSSLRYNLTTISNKVETYTVTYLHKIFDKYGNKYLAQTLKNELDLHRDSNYTIGITKFEELMKRLLSADTAKWFIDCASVSES